MICLQSTCIYLITVAAAAITAKIQAMDAVTTNLGVNASEIIDEERRKKEREREKEREKREKERERRRERSRERRKGRSISRSRSRDRKSKVKEEKKDDVNIKAGVSIFFPLNF